MKTESGDSTNLDQLTPAQRRQLRHLLATEVMGWKCGWAVAPWDAHDAGGHETSCWLDAEGKWVAPYPGWHPDENPAAALGLLERRIDWVIGNNGGQYNCAIVDEYAVVHEAEASTLPLAVVAAVMEAEGLEVGEVVGDG